MVTVRFYSLLRLMLQRESLELPWHEGLTVGRVLAAVSARLDSPVTARLVDERGYLHAGTIILVNRRNIHHLAGLDTPVGDHDTLALFPPGAGG